MELETHLIVASRLGYLSQNQLKVTLHRCDEVGRMLTGLANSLRKNG